VPLTVGGAAVVGLATPAFANPTTTPTITDCQRAFAATGLLAITNFRDSNFSPEANASLRHRLILAEAGFQVCLAEALG
jgi:hypothetical protein